MARPFGQVYPRDTGWSGSPRTSSTRSPCVVTTMPQAAAQIRQKLRCSSTASVPVSTARNVVRGPGRPHRWAAWRRSRSLRSLPRVPVTGFDHAALPTADSERFLAFYKALGFGIEGEDAWRAGRMPC